MATVIDSLLIELGLDTTKFNAAQQKSVDQLRKLDEQSQKTSKSIAKGAKDMGDGFTFMKDSLIAFGTVLVGLSAFKDLIINTTKQNVELGRSAHILSMNAVELKTWGQIAELTGGSVESMTSTIKGLQQALAGLTVGDTKMVRATSMLGAWSAFDINKQTVDLYKLSDAIVKYKSTHTEAETVMWTEALGIDQSSLLLLEKGSAYLHEHYDEFSKLNEVMNKNAETADKINEAWIRVKSTLEGIKQSFYGWVGKILLSPSSPEDQAAWERYDQIRKKYDESKGGGKSGSTGAANTLMDYFTSQGWTKAQAAGIVGNLMQESSLDPTRKNKTGHTGLAQWNAERQADFRAWAGYGLDDSRADLLKQAQFINYELTQGKYKKAGSSLKTQGTAEGSSNVVMQQYEKPGDYSGAQRAAYANQAMLGAGLTVPSGNSKVVNSNVNIQNLAVNTQATDANGISKDLPVALQQNLLINAGIVGAE